MKITKTKLVEIIKEELDAVLKEEGSGEEWTDNLSDEEFKKYFEAKKKLIDSVLAHEDGTTYEEAEKWAIEKLRPQKSEVPPKSFQAYPPDADPF
jgi:hypothetical protein